MQKETLIIDERIAFTQVESEFEELLKHYVELGAKNVLEIGSYFGSSLHHWLYYSKPEARVISIDLPIRQFCGDQDERVPVQEWTIKNEWKLWTKRNKNKLHLIQARSQDQSTVDEVKKLINGEKILDFLFIDGDHRYEAVKQDFLLYSPFVKSGGIIVLHDIAENEEGGVYKFWDELKTQWQTKAILHHPNKEKGIGVIFV
jgi:predicted O-methyltransferase YrrM